MSKHDSDNVASEYTYTALRRHRPLADRFEIRDGFDVIEKLSARALAEKRVEQLEGQESHFAGRLTIVDTWEKQ